MSPILYEQEEGVSYHQRLPVLELIDFDIPSLITTLSQRTDLYCPIPYGSSPTLGSPGKNRAPSVFRGRDAGPEPPPTAPRRRVVCKHNPDGQADVGGFERQIRPQLGGEQPNHAHSHSAAGL